MSSFREGEDVPDWIGGPLPPVTDKLKHFDTNSLSDEELDRLTVELDEQRKLPAYRRGISAAALMAKQFEPVRFVIPGLVAEGATLFAGKPKIGKSWMVLGFAISIASGSPVFGSIPVPQGDVLYLALEDSERRLKSRMLTMGMEDAPERLTLVTEWPGLDDGCIEEMGLWADQAERPTLIIIDVLKMVLGETGRTEKLYDADYRSLSGLAKFARERGIAVMVIHHTRKAEADDPLEAVSGTNGLTGAADAVMVLTRNFVTGHCDLHVRGRDVEECDLAVRLLSQVGTWELLGKAREVGRTNERQAILDVLRDSDKPLSSGEISDILGKNNAAVRQILNRMAHAGEVEKPSRGLYACHNGHDLTNASDPPECDFVTGVTEYEHQDDDDDEWLGTPPRRPRDSR